MQADDVLTIVRRCPQCDGIGEQDTPHCGQCGATVDEGWLANERHRMPCGHYDVHLLLHRSCERCAGSGMLRVQLTPQQFRRRRFARALRLLYVVLAIAALLLLVALVIRAG